MSFSIFLNSPCLIISNDTINNKAPTAIVNLSIFKTRIEKLYYFIKTLNIYVFFMVIKIKLI